MIKTYRKKPVEITAIQWDGKNDTYYEIRNFINDKNVLEVEIDDHLYEAGVGVPYVYKMYIKTLEGKMLVSKGDFIIKGVNGEFYPCKPNIFKKTYDEIKENK